MSLWTCPLEEVKRIDVTSFFDKASTYEIDCINCGKPVFLHYNGGELDTSFCCNLKYDLECKQIDLVIYKEKKENAS